MADPVLSIIVTVVDGGPAVRRILEALHAFENPPPLDIILPYDASVADVEALKPDFPDVAFLPIGEIATERPITSEAGQHELFDRRRAGGLAIAKGDLIAIVEDRGSPRPDWARNAVNLHAAMDAAVIGGAVEFEDPAPTLNWAIYVTDFTRYGLPLPEGPVDWVTDVNVVYKRRAMDATAHLWKDRYQEPVVHWHLIQNGEEMRLSNDLVVMHRRPPLTFGRVLPERFDWGRLFGAIRSREMGLGKRLLMAAASPAIVATLLVRHGRAQAARGRLGRYLKASPRIAVLLTAWTAGEAWGYITGRA